ncbi:hypothetical protein [Alienimonas sp. DA493]|uniref:hypothetical protein n=1 Tax=Alienimonas sp. DA493 TaxID=3373605 RepID=UPI003754E2A0
MRRASGPNVSLFPFLTVLLCASGTLIVLLIALSQHVRETPPDQAAAAPSPPAPLAVAVVAVVAPPPEPDPEPLEPPEPALPEPAGPAVPQGPPRVVRLPYEGPDPAEPLRRRLSAARTAAAEATARLDAATLRRREAEAKIEAARFAAAEATAALEAAGARLASLEEARESGEAAAARATAQVAEFQSAVAAAAEDDSPRALLPVVRTPEGVTADRPILLECVADGVRLRPYGVTVPVAAAGPTPTGTAPVAAGVQAASAATGESYVLLIVRPDGLPAFYRVAGALSDAGVRFGYELLDEEAEIAWGETTAETAATVSAAVQEALQRLPAPSTTEGPALAGAGLPGAAGSGNGGGGFGANAPADGGAAGPFVPGGTGRSGAGRGVAGGGGAAASGRPDLSKNFPAGSPADRLMVNGPTPALAASHPAPAGGRFSPFAGGPADRAGAASAAASAGAAGGPANSGMERPATTGAGPAAGAPDGNASQTVAGDGAVTDRPGTPVENLPAGERTPQSGAAAGGRGTADRSASGGPSGTESGGTAGGASGGGAAGGSGAASGGREGDRAGGGATRRSSVGGKRDDAAARDTRIRYAVRTPATLAASHLWINDRWVPLPADNERLIAALQTEFDRRLADRGDPPTGFRWSPELRLSVRPDGRRQVSRLIEAAEWAGATVKLEGEAR